MNLGKKLLNHVKTLSSEQFEYLTKLMTMSSADFLDEWFEYEPLKATMSASGIIGTFMGPRSPGSAYVMLHHYMGDIDGAFRAWGFQKGGTGAISMAIARSAEYFGADILTEAPVKKVKVKKYWRSGNLRIIFLQFDLVSLEFPAFSCKFNDLFRSNVFPSINRPLGGLATR